MHSSRCLEHRATLATVMVPSAGRASRGGRASLDFSNAGPFAAREVFDVRERFGFVIVGDVPVVVRVFYGGREVADEDVRLTLDLAALGPLRVLVPGDALVCVYSMTKGWEVWRDDLASLSPGADHT